MKKGLWTADWAVAVVICLLFAFVTYTDTKVARVLDGLERAAYDLGVRGSDRTPSRDVAVIAIDNESIENLGRWPWSRDIHAAMVDKLKAGGAKVIGNLVFYSEPQRDRGLEYIQRLDKLYQDSEAVILGFEQELQRARAELDTDQRLARSVENAANVVLPKTFRYGEPRGNADAPLPQYISANALANPRGVEYFSPIPMIKAETPPIPSIGGAAHAIGHLNPTWDVDGARRKEPLLVRYYSEYFPSVSVQIAAKSLNLRPEEIRVVPEVGMALGRLQIKTDPFLQMLTFYYRDQDGRPAFPVDSFFDVYTDKIPAQKYKDKIVLIGAAADGLGSAQKTPVNPTLSPVEAMAHTVSSILREDFFVSPSWAPWARLLAFVLVAIYLVVAFPRLKAGTAAMISAAALLVILVAHYGLMTTQASWVQLVGPAVLLTLGHVLMTTKRFLMTERGKVRSDQESAESNRMLGLAFQGQGQLDMAFEKLRKCPLDDSIMDLMYNLALDYERKRQFNKAVAVYQYMSDHNSSFRDIDKRLSRGKAMEETVLLGAGSAGAAPGTLLLDGGGVQKPMLGRYEVEKELGKGAMGVVYLGRDPKINRVVAIKTMALSQEFDDDELDEVKARFFREAETAGRLTHPNIVTIFDAGEEHDLAYIAMEFLKGKDLTHYLKGETRVPLPLVIELVHKAAEALDYAHQQGVVHRDIKPANIMYDPESKTMKLTDFGIARITDSSKTKTGMVLGTPSYMSPEQLSGLKVDGRSDLFSLGVMLYQLGTGRLPFKADSMATLMFQIANDPHPDPLQVRPDLPPCLKAIIDKALQKKADHRYSRGAELASDLKACAARVVKAA